MKSSILINYLTNNILPYLYDFFMSVGFRWFIYILLLILNIYVYSQNPKLYTNARKCYKLNCKIFTFLSGMITITLILFGLIILSYIAPFSNSIPDYWYIPVIILIYGIMIQITLTAKIELEDGRFNPPPENLLSKHYRIIINVFLFILLLIFLTQLYLDNNAGSARFSNINYNLLLQIFAIITILNNIFELKDVIGFYACDYSLPLSWDF